MRISDWSSDVCSSDLYVDCERHAGELAQGLLAPDGPGSGESSTPAGCQRVAGRQDAVARCLERWARGRPDRRHSNGGGTGERKGVGEGMRVSVRLDVVGRGTIKKKNGTKYSLR